MAGNTFGTLFRLTSFGESHGELIGGVIDGCPAGVDIDIEKIQSKLDKRKPGQSEIASERKEEDLVRIHSGVFNGRTTGTPIGFTILNKDYRSNDYRHLKEVYRPGHADYVYQAKYGMRDYRGGGRSSARETAVRVVAGAVAEQVLSHHRVEIKAFVHKVGNIKIHNEIDWEIIHLSENNVVRCPDIKTAEEMIKLIRSVRAEGDSVGGVIECRIRGLKAGVGSPVFDKLNAVLAHAMLSINAVKGVEFGAGFRSAELKGSRYRDEFRIEKGEPQYSSNNSGGITGGISNGNEVVFRVAFNPVTSIPKLANAANTLGQTQSLSIQGRHDPCVVPRAVPVVEAMAAIAVLDQILMSAADKI